MNHRHHFMPFRMLLVAAALLLVATPGQAGVKPALAPLDSIPATAVYVDLLSQVDARESNGPGFTPASLAALTTRNGRYRIGTQTQLLELLEPVESLTLQLEAERIDAVIEVLVYRGEHAIGSLLFALDGKPRPGMVAASNNDSAGSRIGVRARQLFDRVELRVAHAPDGRSGLILDSAWIEPSANRGSDNGAALLCQTPLGIAHNIAFGASLVPGSGLFAQGIAYTTNLALKWCQSFIEAPPDRSVRVPAGTCAATFEQPHMASTYANVLGISIGYNSNWGELGSPVVFHHNSEVDVMLLYNTPTPRVSPSLDLGFWAETGSFEATDRIWEECDDDNGLVRFSQLDGTGPMYECPFVADRQLEIPVGGRTLRWRSNARISPLDLFAPLIPGIPPGAKQQPWRGLLINVIREAILIANDVVFFSGWRIDNTRDVFQQVTVFDEIPPTVTPQPVSDDRVTATLVGDRIEVTIEADEAGGVSRLRYEPLLRSMFALSDACDRSVSFSASYPDPALRSFWPVSTTSQDNAFEITWTASDPGPNLIGERNQTVATMQVEVVDTQPPVIVAPDDIVEVTTGQVTELGQPLVFDFVDLDPLVSNDANLPLGMGLHMVNWTVTDASGNSDSTVQLVNIKTSNLAPAPIAQTGSERVDAVSFEPTPIRLQGIDPDSDPLRFFIEDAPDNGFFVAPLYPYFVEDFRIEQSLSDAQVLDLCNNGQGAGRNFHLDFPSEPRHLTSTDDGRTFVVDRGYIDCQAGSPVTFDREGRIAVFDNDGMLLNAQNINADELRDVVLDVNQDRLFLASHASGDQSSLLVYDLDLQLQVNYRLQNLRNRDDGASCNPVLPQPGGGCTLNLANSAVADANGLIYVLNRYSAIIVLDGTLPTDFDCSVSCNHTPTLVGVLNDDGTSTNGSGNELALDDQGRLYSARRSRLYRYLPSFIAGDGLAYPGTLEGWLGRCDVDLAAGDLAVCDVANHRSLGFSCSDATCAVDLAFNPEEQAICGSLGIGSQPSWGCRPGQFRGVPALDIDPQGVVYVADGGNRRIQRFSTDGFFAGQAESTCDGSCFVLGDFGSPQNVSVNSSRFYILDPATNLLHISLLTPFVEIGPDYADLEYQSNNDFACVDPSDCIDSFSFRVSDGVRDPVTGQPMRSDPALVEIGVVRNFRPPFATPGIAVVLNEDTPTPVTLDGSDPDPLDTLDFAVVLPPLHGEIMIAGNQATYSPDPDFFGNDSFSFAASDGVLTSEDEMVTVTVAEVNDPPLIQVPAPATVGVGFIYRLSAEFTDPDPNEQHLLVINWGDGSVEPEGGINMDGSADGPQLGQSGNGPGTIRADHIYTTPGNYTAQICLTDRVSGDDGSEVPAPGLSLTACESFPVQAIGGLDLVMSALQSTERALPNQLVSIDFMTINEPPTAGPSTIATGVELIVDLPEGLTPGSITVSGSNCTRTGLQVSCDVGTLNPGFTASAEITARVDGMSLTGTALTFTASASADQVDVNPDNELAHTVSVSQPADLYVDAIDEAFLDKPDILPGDGNCESEDGVCTLRAAIEEANAQPGLQVVALGTGVYPLTEDGIFVTDDILLTGNGVSKSFIDGIDGSIALFVQNASVTLRIEDLTLSRGGIRLTPGDLVVRRARLTGAVQDSFFGGAVFADNLIDIRDTTFDNNQSIDGAAVWGNPQSHGVFENVIVTGNRGGGLTLRGMDYTINNVTITGNTGGVFVAQGGALNILESATATITGSIVAGNYSVGGSVNCLADAPAILTSGGGNLFGDLAGCSLTPVAGDVVIDDNESRLQPLRFVDGLLPFVAPFDDSPAVDAMFGPDCPPTDALGTLRPVDGDGDGSAVCDIGAVELIPDLAPPALQLSSARIVFDDIDIGNTSPPQSITISNAGELPLNVGSINITGGNAADFAIPGGSDNCSSGTLTPSQTCNFEVIFMPQQTGIRNAEIQISSNDPAGIRVITLAGSSGVLFFDGFEAD